MKISCLLLSFSLVVILASPTEFEITGVVIPDESFQKLARRDDDDSSAEKTMKNLEKKLQNLTKSVGMSSAKDSASSPLSPFSSSALVTLAVGVVLGGGFY